MAGGVGDPKERSTSARVTPRNRGVLRTHQVTGAEGRGVAPGDTQTLLLELEKAQEEIKRKEQRILFLEQHIAELHATDEEGVIVFIPEFEVPQPS